MMFVDESIHPQRVKVAGFTLIELLVVMGILGILAAAVMPLGEALLVAQKERDLRRALWEIRGAIDSYKKHSERDKAINGFDGSGYPPTLATLVNGVDEVSSTGRGARVYFLRRLPRDPFADPKLAAEATWLLRSYASPPDQPKPGADVYDIRSSSNSLALDGSSYASW